jgi:hypothetical protein
MQRRLDEAEPLAKRAFVGTMFEFGPTHDDALDSAQNFSEILAMGGKLEESARVLRQMFDVCERAFGRKDARTLAMARNLSMVQDMINRTKEG